MTYTPQQDRIFEAWKGVCSVWERLYDEARSKGAIDEEAWAVVKGTTIAHLRRP